MKHFLNDDVSCTQGGQPKITENFTQYSQFSRPKTLKPMYVHTITVERQLSESQSSKR